MGIQKGVGFLGMVVFLMGLLTSGGVFFPVTSEGAGFSAKDSPRGKTTNQHIRITSAQSDIIGAKIWFNETGGRRKNLIMWNEGEGFLSVGVGHFIWYPKNRSSGFEESFPKLIAFLKQQGVVLPGWLTRQTDCPWATKDDFLKQAQNRRLRELQTLLASTVPQQVQFLIHRLESALPIMLASLNNQLLRAHVREQFYRVAATPEGVYALVDYVNFKGEGVSVHERYHGQGWGLLQVLLFMQKGGYDARIEFADAAEIILTQRVHNAPENRYEERWLRGWKNRINTYRNIVIE